MKLSSLFLILQIMEEITMPKAIKKKAENVSLETVLWNCRVALRGVGSTDKNRDAVIGLCFLKFAGDKNIVLFLKMIFIYF